MFVVPWLFISSLESLWFFRQALPVTVLLNCSRCWHLFVVSPVMPCSNPISLRLLSRGFSLPFPCGLRQPDGVMCQTIRSLSPIQLSHTQTDTRPGNKISIFPFRVRFEPEVNKHEDVSPSSVLTLNASPRGETKQTCGKLPQSFASFPGIGVYTPLCYMGLHRVLIPPCRTPL